MNRRLCLVLSVGLSTAAIWCIHAKAARGNVGRQLPELKLAFVGQKPDLAGKPLFLDFWATWCEPCREGIPHLNELWKSHKDRGLVIIGVTREDEATVRAFLQEVAVDYPVARDAGAELAAHFGVIVIPHAMLVDRSGRITWEGHPQTMQPGDIEGILK